MGSCEEPSVTDERGSAELPGEVEEARLPGLRVALAFPGSHGAGVGSTVAWVQGRAQGSEPTGWEELREEDARESRGQRTLHRVAWGWRAGGWASHLPAERATRRGVPASWPWAQIQRPEAGRLAFFMVSHRDLPSSSLGPPQ